MVETVGAIVVTRTTVRLKSLKNASVHGLAHVIMEQKRINGWPAYMTVVFAGHCKSV